MTNEAFKSHNANIPLLVRNFIDRHFENKGNKQAVIDEAIELAQVFINEVKRDNIQSANALKDEAIEKIRNELATKDFVRAEIAEVRQELKQDIAEVRQEIAEVRQEIEKSKNATIKWTLGAIASASVLVISANFALIGFLVQNLKG